MRFRKLPFTDASLLVSLQSPAKLKNGKFLIHKLFGFTVSVENNLYFWSYFNNE